MSLSNLFWGVFGIVVWFAIPTVCLWFLVDGLRTGVVRVKLGSYSRDHSPVWFWLCISMYGGLALWVFYLTALVVADAAREGWRF